ncbi:MAG: hypothetical protein QXT05_00285 [Candidatus Bilamarchaeaceae archaeon]
MDDELLIDYLETASEYIRVRKEKLADLRREYEEAFDKEIREEMDILKGEIKAKRAEIIDKLYENVDELRHIKKYFPEFFKVLLEDEEIGKILKRRDFLFDARPVPPNTALKLFAELVEARRQLKDAIGFLEKWQGVITERQLTATYPILKGKISGDMESTDAIEKIKMLDEKLKKEGWRIIISNEQLTAQKADMLMKRLKKAELELRRAELNYEEAKNQGSVNEYIALKTVKKFEEKKARWERAIRRLLLANPAYLSSLKKKSWLQREKRGEIEHFAENIAAKKVKEKIWLDKMRKRLR